MQSLADIIDTMQVPQARKRDVAWLLRNLRVANSDHPQLEEAIRRLIVVQQHTRSQTS